jgi:gliding motility-associated lipoprotein GldH
MTMFGCGDRQKMIYHDYQSTAADGWKKKDTLKMEILPSDSACVVSLFAEVRNGLNYPYSNLYLVVKQNLTDSIHWQTDTIHFTLADSLGRWTGIGGGHFYQSSAYVRTLRLPPHPKHTVIRVSHGMKDDVLKGISDVGFRLVVR